MLAEAGLPDLTTRFQWSIGRQINRICNTPGSSLQETLIKQLRRKTRSRITSSLQLVICKARALDILILSNKKHKETVPPWFFKNGSILLNLSQYKKDTTPDEIFKLNFNQIRSQYSSWKFIFTDGSKNENATALSVVNQNTHPFSRRKPRPF